MTVNKDQLILKLASQLNDDVVRECVKEAGVAAESGRPMTSLERYNTLLENCDFDKIASDEVRLDAFEKLAAEANEDRFILRLADVVTDMAIIKEVAMQAALEEDYDEYDVYEDEYEGSEKQASAMEELDYLLGLDY